MDSNNNFCNSRPVVELENKIKWHTKLHFFWIGCKTGNIICKQNFTCTDRKILHAFVCVRPPGEVLAKILGRYVPSRFSKVVSGTDFLACNLGLANFCYLFFLCLTTEIWSKIDGNWAWKCNFFQKMQVRSLELKKKAWNGGSPELKNALKKRGLEGCTSPYYLPMWVLPPPPPPHQMGKGKCVTDLVATYSPDPRAANSTRIRESILVMIHVAFT